MKNPNDTIWNRTSDLQICSTAPQPLCYRGRHISMCFALFRKDEWQQLIKTSDTPTVVKNWSCYTSKFRYGRCGWALWNWNTNHRGLYVQYNVTMGRVLNSVPHSYSNTSLLFTADNTLQICWYYVLTPWCRVLLEKLTGLQLVKKFPAFHGTRRFITALTSVRHLSLSWASPIQSIYPHPTSWRS